MNSLATLSINAGAILKELADFYDEPDPMELFVVPANTMTPLPQSNAFDRSAALNRGNRDKGLITSLKWPSEPVRLAVKREAFYSDPDVTGGVPLGSAIFGRLIGRLNERVSGSHLTFYGDWEGPLELAIHELGRLPDGWAGAGSKAPSSAILLDLQSLNALLPAGVPSPEVEVDQDDGFVSLRWFDNAAANSLTISFFGGHRIIVTFSSLEGNDRPARELNVRESREVTSVLSENFESLLTTNAVP